MFETHLYFRLELFEKLSNNSYKSFDYFDLYEDDEIFDVLNKINNKDIEAAELYFFCGDTQTLMVRFKKKITKKNDKKIVNWVVVS